MSTATSADFYIIVVENPITTSRSSSTDFTVAAIFREEAETVRFLIDRLITAEQDFCRHWYQRAVAVDMWTEAILPYLRSGDRTHLPGILLITQAFTFLRLHRYRCSEAQQPPVALYLSEPPVPTVADLVRRCEEHVATTVPDASGTSPQSTKGVIP